MEFHQPDSAFPERMLATCHHCQSWYILDFAPDRSQTVMVQLPAAHAFLNASVIEASGPERDDPG
jgi:hypothetical protein